MVNMVSVGRVTVITVEKKVETEVHAFKIVACDELKYVSGEGIVGLDIRKALVSTFSLFFCHCQLLYLFLFGFICCDYHCCHIFPIVLSILFLRLTDFD